jgi:RNA polymerase sigma factor for flagellar operon FliA
VLARVKGELALVEIIARQLYRTTGKRVPLDDLLSYGREGLLIAARIFEPNRGVPFRRWANLRVRGAMIDGIRKNTELPRRVYRNLMAMIAADEVQEVLTEEDAASHALNKQDAEKKLEGYLVGIATAMAVGMLSSRNADDLAKIRDTEDSPEEQAARAQVKAKLHAQIETLPEKEKEILVRHYIDDMTLENAASAMGLSKSWGSRLHARAVQMLGERLAIAPLE